VATGKREKVTWFAAGWRVCVTAIWCPRHPRKFLIKFSPLPGARPDREGRAGTPSEFFSSVLVEQRPSEPILPPFYPLSLATLGNFRLRLLLSRRSLFAAKWALLIYIFGSVVLYSLKDPPWNISISLFLFLFLLYLESVPARFLEM